MAETKTKSKPKSKQDKASSKTPADTASMSKWCEVRGSDIHGRGLFASCKIPKDAEIIEYVGERITKDESDRRGWERFDRAQGTGEAAGYLFTLNDDWDIDGDVEWNSARLINHSCDPNCEAVLDEDHIWISALRDLKKGEELYFNYCFDLDNFEGHPCRCGSDRCVGFIVGEEYWPKLLCKLEKIDKKARKKKDKKREKKRNKNR